MRKSNLLYKVTAQMLVLLMLVGLCACNSSKNTPGGTPGTPGTPAFPAPTGQEQGSPDSTGDSLLPAIADKNKDRYAVKIEESDAPGEDAIAFLLNYKDDENSAWSQSQHDFWWLDIDTLIREITYANALVRAYKEGSCPEEVAEEAELLAYIKTIIETDNRDVQFILGINVGKAPYLWEFVVAEMDNLYQIAGQLNFEYNIDDDSFYEVLDERLSIT